VGYGGQGSRCLVGVGSGADQCPSAARNDGQRGGRGVGSERGPIPGVAGVLPDGSGAQGQIGKVPRALNPLPRRVGVCQRIVQRVGRAVQVLRRGGHAAALRSPSPGTAVHDGLVERRGVITIACYDSSWLVSRLEWTLC